MVNAEEGIEQLKDKVDTLIIIPNQRLMDVIDRKMTLLEAFRVVDSVLSQGVQGISDIITVPGLINVDFADVKTIMKNAGSALMGIGTGVGTIGPRWQPGPRFRRRFWKFLSKEPKAFSSTLPVVRI